MCCDKVDVDCASTIDAFCDRGGTFPLFGFLNDGVPYPKIVGMAILFRNIYDVLVYWGHGNIHREALPFFGAEAFYDGGGTLPLKQI